MRLLDYLDTATFFKTEPSGYGNDKIVASQDDVPVIFLQSTGFNRTNYQEGINGDAICYPDPQNEFVVANHNRLEGMYILAPLFGISDDEGWYKVIAVRVNRDHLLSNTIDNVELVLKKSRRVAGIS
jgi:hypothetical protein